MKVINPIGKDSSAYIDANYATPKACVCANGMSFSSALGYVDTCSHCGCNCLAWNKEANFNKAYNANHANG